MEQYLDETFDLTSFPALASRYLLGPLHDGCAAGGVFITSLLTWQKSLLNAYTS